MATAIDSEKTQNTTELLTSLIPTGQELSKCLSKHASINPWAQLYTTDLLNNVTIITSVLVSLQETYTDQALLDEKVSTQIMPVLLQGIQIVFSKIEKGMQTAVEFVSEPDWLDHDDALKRGIAWPYSANALQDALGLYGGAREVQILLEDTGEALAFLNNAFKYIALSKIKKGERDASQKRELGRIIQQYPPRLLDGIKRILTRLIKNASSAQSQIENGRDAVGLPFNSQSRDPMYKREGVARSFISYDSFATNQFVEAKELYEYWVFQRVELPSRIRKTWSVFGFRVDEKYDDPAYTFDGKAKPQAVMKAKDEETRTESEFHAREKRNAETLASLPQRFQVELLYLLQDRDRVSTNQRFVREWEVVEIQKETPKIKTASQSWGSWWKGQGGTTQWGCIIKGTTTTIVEDGERVNNRVPDRYQDPFRNSYRPLAPERRDRFYDYDEVRVEPAMPRVIRNSYEPVRNRQFIKTKAPTEEEYEKEIRKVFDKLVELAEDDGGPEEKFEDDETEYGK